LHGSAKIIRYDEVVFIFRQLWDFRRQLSTAFSSLTQLGIN
jgi:hypothetical protein